MRFRHALAIGLALLAAPAAADAVKVVNVAAHPTGSTWRIEVTLRHGDTGWDHYADGWEVLDEAGKRLGYRELLHPHENEQPFTRSLDGVRIPDGVTKITVRPHCSLDGWAGAPKTITLKR